LKTEAFLKKSHQYLDAKCSVLFNNMIMLTDNMLYNYVD